MSRLFIPPEAFTSNYDRFARFGVLPSMGGKRIFLVAIQGEAYAPSPFGQEPLPRMQPLLATPEQAEDLGSANLTAYPMPRAVPMTHRDFRFPDEDAFYARPVEGEILRDQSGNFYEKIGPTIRPLGKLVQGPNGEVLELRPPAGHMTARSATATAPEFVDAEVEDYTEDEEPGARPREATPQPGAARATAGACRKLFDDPGLWRVVRLGDFKSMLTRQLAHPERIRDLHRLACYVQVYECTTRQPLEALIASLRANGNGDIPVQPLTNAVVARLGLRSFLVGRPQAPPPLRRQAGLAFPYDRFFRLDLVEDPTADQADQQETRGAQAEAVPSPPASAFKTVEATPGPKTTIPERFLKPWEFQLSREEALYAMNVAPVAGNLLQRLWRQIKASWSRGSEFRKWKALLFGKTLEEQLWGVRPPKGMLDQVALRDWARRTLELAGYDAQPLLPEWEIFWRRKGAE